MRRSVHLVLMWLSAAAAGAGATGAGATGAGATGAGLDPAEDLSFPPGFMFGAATASYQVEGAWNVSDKSESIWDTFVRAPGAVADGSSGEDACRSYHLWPADVAAAAALGLTHYRFSISWPRLLPSGFADRVSPDGARYYSDLIDGLLRAGVAPLVTMHHFDLPQSLQDLGGWVNPAVVDWFGDYARVLFALYGARVRLWLTLNEPVLTCTGYGAGLVAPGVRAPERGNYLCNKNMLLAHARAYRIYDEEFREKYGGKVSLANQMFWFEADTPEPEHEDAAEMARQDFNGRYAHAVFSAAGGWPAGVERAVAEHSRAEGLPRSRLPPFTPAERDYVQGTFDFLALNYYTSRAVRAAPSRAAAGPFPLLGAPEHALDFSMRPEWDTAASFWFAVHPPGLRALLGWLRREYGPVEVLVTENGYPTAGRGRDDAARARYIRDHLVQLLRAIKLDGANVVGYTVWSLIDNFEWIDGYTRKFGLYDVDFSAPLRPRAPRRSAAYLAAVVRAHSLHVPDQL